MSAAALGGVLGGGLVDITGDDHRTQPCETLGDRRTDPAARTGDDDHRAPGLDAAHRATSRRRAIMGRPNFGRKVKVASGSIGCPGTKSKT